MAQTRGGFSARFAPTERPAFQALRGFVAGSNDECPIVVLPRPGWPTGSVRHGVRSRNDFRCRRGQKADQQLSGRYDRKLSTAYVNRFVRLTAPEALHGNRSFASGPLDGESRRSAVKPFCLEPSREAFQKQT